MSDGSATGSPRSNGSRRGRGAHTSAASRPRSVASREARRVRDAAPGGDDTRPGAGHRGAPGAGPSQAAPHEDAGPVSDVADAWRPLAGRGMLGWLRLAAGAATATILLPVALLRLVARVDQMLTDYGGLLAELADLLEESVEVRAAVMPLLSEGLPTLRALVPALDELAPVLQEGAPLLRTLLPVLEAGTPALQELAPVGNDLVPVLAAAAPGLRALVPLLDDAAPLLNEVLPALAEAMPVLRRLVAEARPDLATQILRVLVLLEATMPEVATVGDAERGLAAVATHTDHLVELADDLIGQVQSLPGAGALLRRSRRSVKNEGPGQ